MSQFVDECRKEWRRLGVPEVVANEMATDLDADLAEAHADGVSPEAVLGNGFFDPTAFAASWAAARGLVNPGPHVVVTRRLRSWTLAVGTGLSLLSAMLGLVVLLGRRFGSESVAVAAVGRPIFNRPPIPGVFVGPQQVSVSHAGFAFTAVGSALFLAGLVGLAVTLWLWRRRSTRGDGPEFDEDIGLPSYL